MKTVDYCTKRCFLCDEINSKEPLSYYLDVYENPTDKVLFESPHFIAMPDISPIVPGHSLLFPKNHLLSLSQLQSIEWQEFKRIKNSIVKWAQNNFGSVFVFEHGTVIPEIGSGVCVQHAHLHVIPAHIDQMQEKLQEYIKGPIVFTHSDMQIAVSGIMTSYIYYENSDGLGCAITLNDSLPQQFIRKLVADALNLPNWDWKSIALPYLL